MDDHQGWPFLYWLACSVRPFRRVHAYFVNHTDARPCPSDAGIEN